MKYPEDNPSGFFMQDITRKKEERDESKIKDLSLEDRQRLVGVFAWLLKEDKKQNPALYQRNKQKQND